MSARINATKMTFVLGMFCLAILGYAAIAYIYFSFHTAPDTASIPYYVIRQRTALSALAMTVGISCVIMGFAAFMIGAKGEVNFKADSSWGSGALASGVPGPFFVLCGTVIAVTVLLARVSHEEAVSGSDPSGAASVVAAAPSASRVTRTIASANQKVALYSPDVSVYNQLMAIAVGSPDEASNDALEYLLTHDDDLFLVAVDWDEGTQEPKTSICRDLVDQDRRFNVSEGYLIVLNRNGGAEAVKSLLHAGGQIVSYFAPSARLPNDRVLLVLRQALADRIVIKRGERS